ncbi:hypothetical protein E4K72_09575 [Oxalobacteraceae bacterium OM1]|nr:hypothetical protein E4K72_09575 [Oxalobacteraceae bacterium OM1]
MTMRFRLCLIGIALCVLAARVSAAPFAFAVVAHAPATGGEAGLREAIERTDADNLAFVVVNGLKRGDEACADSVYVERSELLQQAKNGIIVSPAASDWVQCPPGTRTAANGRLNRLRELLFADDFSQGGSRLPLVRQSAVARFRGFPENARWEIGQVLFATVDLPAGNNHFVTAAGRNSEFEDRSVANRDWIHRLFVYAALRKMKVLVLFCDGDPMQPPPGVARDGYAEVRRQLTTRATKFNGKVVIVHAEPHGTAGAIEWHDGIGRLAVPPGTTRVAVDVASGVSLDAQPLAGSSGRSR